jgi:hypothetical protein
MVLILYWQLGRRRAGQPRFGFVAVLVGQIVYRVSNQYLKKFSYDFWDNQWFGRNQIYYKSHRYRNNSNLS